MQFSFLMCLLLLLCQSSLWWGVVSPCSRPGFRHHFNRRTTNPSTFQHFSASFFISVVVSNSAAPSQLSAPYKHQQPHSGPSPYLNVVELWWADAVQVCPPPLQQRHRPRPAKLSLSACMVFCEMGIPLNSSHMDTWSQLLWIPFKQTENT